MVKSLTRRHFVAGMAVMGGTLVLGGCSPAKPEQSSTGGTGASENQSTDILIIGSGLAGLSAARSAAEGGAKVMLVDKGGFLASTFLTSKGNHAVAQVAENQKYWQFPAEAPDTMDAFLSRWKTMTEVGKRDVAYPEMDRVEHLMGSSCETIAWVEEMGLDFQQSFAKEKIGVDIVKPDNSATPETAGGALIAEAFENKLKELGVTIMLNTDVTDIRMDGNKAIGVTAAAGSKGVDIDAKAVVLATGGFGGSEEYCKKYVPELAETEFQYQGNALNTGDGMTMASAVDGALHEDAWVVPFMLVPSKKLIAANKDFSKLNAAGMPEAAIGPRMLVNATGERFINEALYYTALSTAMADLKQGPYYVMFDSSNPAIVSILETGLSTGEAFKADTIAELQAASGMTSLATTYETYQQASLNGTDPVFNKPAANLATYAEGPLYLVRYVPTYVATIGGVKTDSNCQVINTKGTPIDGLYAIGEVAHRFLYNRNMIQNASNTASLAMGKETGTLLAKTIA